MKLSPKAIIIALFTLLFFLIGFVFFRGPPPHISIKPQTLFSVAPIDVTNTILPSGLVVLTMIIVVFLAPRRWEVVPRGAQNVVEAVVEAFYNLVVNVAGEKNGRRFFPVVATIFFFVLASNWLSLLPVFNVIGGVVKEKHGFVFQQSSGVNYVPFSSPSGLRGESIDENDANAGAAYDKAIKDGKSVGELVPFLRGPNTDLNTTVALAIVSAIAVETWGITSLGLFRYGSKFFNFGGMLRGVAKLSPAAFFQGAIDAFVGFLEFVSEL